MKTTENVHCSILKYRTKETGKCPQHVDINVPFFKKLKVSIIVARRRNKSQDSTLTGTAEREKLKTPSLPQ